MDKVNLLKNVQSSRLQRNILLGVCALLLISTTAQSIYLNKQNRTVVIVPTHVTSEFEVSTNHVTSDYLEIRARDVAQSFLNLTPQNSKYFIDAILRSAHPRSHLDLSNQIKELLREVKEKDLRTYFLPNETKVSVDTLEVEVSGYLETFIGQRQVSSELKKYMIGFDAESSRLLLTKFEEEKS